MAVGDEDVGYFGEVTNAEMFTADELAAQLPTMVGLKIATNDPDPWLKFFWYGKYLFIKKRPLYTSITGAQNSPTCWNKLYRAGLLYGEDGFGTYNDGFPTLQLKFVTKDEFRFKVRTITGDDEHLTTMAAGNPGRDTEIRRKSMYTELLYRVSDQIHPLYPEKKFDNFIPNDLSGRWEVTREVFISTAYPKGNSLLRSGGTGQPSMAYYTTVAPRTTPYAWRPVLELAKADELFQVRHTSTLVVGGTIIPPAQDFVGTGDPQRMIEIQILSNNLSPPAVRL